MMEELMNQKNEIKELSCPVVRDLLPTYIEHLTSVETNEMIEAHLNSCADCSQLKAAMVSEIKTKKAPLDPDVKKIMVRTRNRMLLNGIFLWAGILGILVSTIVDLAVSHGLTWSLIVDGGIVFADLIVLAFTKCKKHRFIGSLAVVSVGVLPYLYLIQQVVNAHFMTESYLWFATYAVPISILWIGILWALVLIQKVLHLNLWQVIATLLLGSLVGSPVTDMIATQLPFREAYIQNYGWIDTIITLAVAVGLLVVGKMRKNRVI